METGDISAWMREVGDVAAADRIRNPREHDRNCAGDLLQSRYDWIGRDEDYIRCHRDHFRGRDAHTLGAFTGEPVIELDIGRSVQPNSWSRCLKGRSAA